MNRVIKIDIKKELIKIPSSNCQKYREVDHDSLPIACAEEDGYKNSTVTVKEKVYQRRRLVKDIKRSNIAKEFDEPVYIDYFVLTDDNDIFDDLVQIGNDDIRRNFDKGAILGETETLLEIKRFLKLPFYKRLFIKDTLKNIEKRIFNLRQN